MHANMLESLIKIFGLKVAFFRKRMRTKIMLTLSQ
jgi:hypothetical protein